MLIKVEHTTSYAYSSPLMASTQYLRMTPLSGNTQAVETWRLTCPGTLITPWQDQYGNACHTLIVAAPLSELEIRVSGLVRTRDTSGVFGLSPSELPPDLYLRQTPYTVAAPSISDFAERFRGEDGKGGGDILATAHDIMLAVRDAVEYSPGDTHVHTTGAEALEQGSGVCQDHAHIFCAACRHLDIPARYVSGYLTSGSGHEAHAASHAWAEIFVDDLGWVGFDPTNRICPTESYIRTAVGLDYGEASPVRGVRSGGGKETMQVRVTFPGQYQQQQAQ